MVVVNLLSKLTLQMLEWVEYYTNFRAIESGLSHMSVGHSIRQNVTTALRRKNFCPSVISLIISDNTC